MKKTILLSTALLISLASCTDEPAVENPAPQSRTEITLSKDQRDELKETFGKAFGLALTESPELRKLIKDEALKMFDNDYDVLYLAIKDVTLTEGQTVRELLLQHVDGEEELLQIENGVPLLTIFVPELPEETFSAKLWNAESVIPAVGITSYKTNDVKIIEQDGNEFVLEAQHIPAFPVVVIKENERVIHRDARNSSKVKGKAFRAGNSEFLFLADCFDGSIKSEKENARITKTPDQKLLDAYNIYLNIDGWHRDYVYYNIQPTQDRGPFSYDYMEYIRSFRMNGDPVSAYSKIADQTGDPTLKTITGSPNSGWTGGYYEFKVRVLLNAKNGVGEELITYFSALPDDLFVVEYEKKLFFYMPKITGFRSKSVDLPLFAWDLNDYASTIKIEVEEVDLTETIVNSETRTVKFATNFAIEGTLKKIGLKFGASLEETRSQTVSRTYTLGNDQLGGVIVNFADDVVLGPVNILFIKGWRTREYETGWYGISVEPKRVQ
ncbi:hypothetical protein LVD17_16415 [Fulvivirga ulvae]|uniref:hypothetical protein n=1 Tax=Fulvivirga ulvae TaxID=2904245 RepID=UPI001F21C330|nr:hypothetical protein [Fulvivirga ulvae]UII29884.1 hypothetical protein LVD17_16415 [Fulvivirga ulvae]